MQKTLGGDAGEKKRDARWEGKVLTPHPILPHSFNKSAGDVCHQLLSGGVEAGRDRQMVGGGVHQNKGKTKTYLTT